MEHDCHQSRRRSPESAGPPGARLADAPLLWCEQDAPTVLMVARPSWSPSGQLPLDRVSNREANRWEDLSVSKAFGSPQGTILVPGHVTLPLGADCLLCHSPSLWPTVVDGPPLGGGTRLRLSMSLGREEPGRRFIATPRSPVFPDSKQ